MTAPGVGPSVAAMTNHSMKMMWACVALLALVAVLSVAGSNAGYLLFAVPCMLMTGAMLWLMLREMGGGGTGRGDQK